MSARHFSIRFSLCFALLMAGAGVQLPFLPLWMHAKGLTTAEIGSVLAAMMVSRAIASPLLSYIADQVGNRLIVVRSCAGLALFAYLLLSQASGFLQILGAAALSSFVFAAVFPLTENYSINSSARLGLDYGRLRLWASVSFLAGSLVSGYLLTFFNPLDAIWMIIAGQGCAFVASFILPREPWRNEPVAQHAFDAQSAKRLLFGSQFTLVVIAVSLGQASHALLNGFSSVYWTSLGISPFMIGVFWTAAVLAEVLMFSFSQRLVNWLGHETLMLVGLFGGMFRWMLTAFIVDPWLMTAVQTLHVLSFATLHLGTMHYIRAAVPPRLQNTAQGLYAALSGGICMALVTRMAGEVYADFGGKAFLFMALVSAVAIAQLLYVFRFIPTRQVVAAE